MGTKSFPDLTARDRDFLLATVMKPSSSTSAEVETGSLSGTGWRRTSRGCDSTSVGGGGGISGDNNGNLGWGAEMVVLGEVVVGGAWRRAELAGCGSVEPVEAVRSQNQQDLNSCLRRRDAADTWWLPR